MKAPNVAVSVHSFHRTVHYGINLRGTLPVGLDLNVNQAVSAFALAWTGLRQGSQLNLIKGTFDANDFDVNFKTFYASNTNTRTLYMGSGT